MEEETQEGKLSCMRTFVLRSMFVLDFDAKRVCIIIAIIFIYMCYKKN